MFAILKNSGLSDDDCYSVISKISNKKILENLEEDNYTWYKVFDLYKITVEQNKLDENHKYQLSMWINKSIKYDITKDYKQIYIWYRNLINPNKSTICTDYNFNNYEITKECKLKNNDYPIDVYINQNWDIKNLHLVTSKTIYDKYELHETLGKNNKLTKILCKYCNEKIYIYPYDARAVIKKCIVHNNINFNFKLDKLKFINIDERKFLFERDYLINSKVFEKEFLINSNDGDLFLSGNQLFINQDNFLKIYNNKYVIVRYPVTMWYHLCNENNLDEVIFRHLSDYFKEIKNNLKIHKFIFLENIEVKVCISKFNYNFVDFYVVAVVLSKYCDKHLSSWCDFNEFHKNVLLNISKYFPLSYNNQYIANEIEDILNNDYRTYAYKFKENESLDSVTESSIFLYNVKYILKNNNIDINHTLFLGNIFNN